MIDATSLLRKQAAENGSTVDETVRVYGEPGKLRIGRNVRIDAFVIIMVGPEGVTIGDDVHVGCNVMVFGSAAKIVIGDRCSLSPRSTIYTASDDFRKAGLIGTQNKLGRVPLIVGAVTMGEGSAIGHGAVLFPGSSLGTGAAVGAGVVVTGDVPAGQVVTVMQTQKRRPRSW